MASPVTTTWSATWNTRKAIAATARIAEWDLRQAIAPAFEAQWPVDPVWSVEEPCPVRPGYSSVFRRLKVDFVPRGGTRVTWELNPHLKDPGEPYTFQLQFSQGNLVTGDDWLDVGGPQTNVFLLADPVQRVYGKLQYASYRIQMTTGLAIYTSPPAPVYGKLDERGFLLTQEFLRKESLRLRIFGSVQGFLLRPRLTGSVGPDVDPVTGEILNTADAYTNTAYGYYNPLSCSYSDMDPESARTNLNLQGTGTERGVVTKGRFVAVPPLWSRDVFVAAESGLRYSLHTITTLYTWRNVPIAQSAELRPIPYTDPVYQVPIPV